jgi:hypothetical protein
VRAVWLIRSAIEALYPRHGETPGAGELGLREFLARFRREAPLLMWVGLVASAVVFTLTPVLTVGWPLPSFWLPAAVRDRHAHALASHRWYLLRQLVMLLKMAGGMCWGQSAAVRAAHSVAAYPADPGTWRRS